jgi:hypothetical protein
MALLGLSLEGLLGWVCFGFIGLIFGIGYVVSSAVEWLSGNETAQEVGKEIAGNIIEDKINDFFRNLFG